MKLPKDSGIPKEKIRDYLLVRQGDNDKSLFLESAGYFREDWERLQKDIRLQLLPLDASFEKEIPFGEIFVITGSLVGPNGKELQVKTVWIKRHETDTIDFVTLFPHRRKTQ